MSSDTGVNVFAFYVFCSGGNAHERFGSTNTAGVFTYAQYT